MATLQVHGSGSFLGWHATTPRLYVTAEPDTPEDFDTATLEAWRQEGFDVQYLPFGDGGKEYVQMLHSIKNTLNLGGTYAIVAFGDAASVCLETFIRQDLKLSALVAYYPSTIPDPHTRYMPSLRVMVHLAGSQVGVSSRPEILGIQGKRRSKTKRIDPGIGTGGLQSKLTYPCYTYQGVEPGFAEHDLDEYDKIADAVAWSRSLDTIRKAFSAEFNLERIWEENEEYKWHRPDSSTIVSTMTDRLTPHVTYTPTLTGGKGKEDLSRFYRECFLPSISPQADPSTNLTTRLLSRTIGVERVVDELLLAFKHTQSMPWILPGIPPTNEDVEIVLVSIVAFRGGKIYSEHVYWDQASVLVQVGLLEPEDVPDRLRDQGVHELPIFGNESAKKVVDEDEDPWNELIEEW